MHQNNFNDCVNIYSNDDQVRLAHLGSVFHNKKSRAMWILLSNNPHREYHLKEMAVIIEKVVNPRLPIYEHHIKTMIRSGIVSTTQKMHNKHKTVFYRAAPITVITSSNHYETAIRNKILKNTFMHVFFNS